MNVSREYLENQAKSLGRSKRWVRYLVDSGLISKADAKGLGRGKGQAWSNDHETVKQLIWVHKLCALFGYRGDALRFVVWWRFGRGSTKEIRRYIANILLKIRDRLERKIQREAAKKLILDFEEPTPGVPIDRAIVLGDIIDEQKMKPIERLSPEDLLSPFIDKKVIYSEDTQQVFDVLLSTIAGINPGDLGVSALYLERQISGLFSEPLDVADPFSGLLYLIHDTAWVEKTVTSIVNCPEDELKKLRDVVLSNTQLSKRIKQAVIWEYRNQLRISRWRLERLGPWRLPAAAYRASAILDMFILKDILGGIEPLCNFLNFLESI